ncbi:Major facilitator superfamily domain, general substrate transporter [Metarhizium rileyi]|uniref:Major facilitator superfamily domain, general substrate transporter n=1 Tax=Metarhizium rileyi (strain RCEF 4871) TaxID=1649241 RepID=A0A167BQ24_METRR|nr:Major facilitator superfamily domain, general substrate transporter [Metarhizium rileyi RCEF 4871]
MHVTKNADPRTPGQAGLFPSVDAAEEKPIPPPQDTEDFSGGSDNLSLEEKNEREVQKHPQQVTANAELGVQKAEAAALVWTKKILYCTYAWIWLCFFMLALQQAILFNVTATAYADFSTAPAIATASILSNIIGGVLKLPIAKTLNIWGRAEGYLVFFGVYVLGIIILASSSGPDSYAAGYVFYWIGYDAIYLILDIFVADTSGLRNRAFAFAFVSTPFICTAFTGPLAAQAFLRNSTWRWAIGCFAIIQPFVFVPLAIVFKFYQKKAERLGIYKNQSSGRTALQSVVHYLHEFDVVGALILIAAFVLFLLPFSLVSYGRATYGSATFIAMVIIGILLFPVFAAWEKWFARTHFIRWELLKQRTVLGACCMAALSFFSFYSWDLYFYSFVLVVYNLNFSDTGYMTQIYNVGSCFWGVVFGIWVKYTKHFKWTVFFFGLPLMILGAGLMIHFRGQEADIGYIIMCQIFIAFGGGTIVIGNSMAVMAASDRDGVPMLLAILSLFASIGGAIGDAVSVAIYSNTFPEALRSRLPAEMAGQVDLIYLGGYLTQIKYPVGSPTRDAINYAWGQSQRYGAISATAILVLGIPSIAIWKNYRVDKKQNKGTVI